MSDIPTSPDETVGSSTVSTVTALALALCLATGSCAIQRHGPDQTVYCALGKSRDGYDIYCPKPVLNGGWPAPYAFDRPGISVEDRIGFPEDSFRPWPFVADIAFYLAILSGARAIFRRVRRVRAIRTIAQAPRQPVPRP